MKHNASKVVHYLSLTFIVLLTPFLLSCGKQNTDNSDKPAGELKLNTLPLIEWPENQTLSYQATTDGRGPFTYFIVQSPDSDLFEINTNTGALTSTATADFENPLDQNSDGIYEITLGVIDASNQAISKSLKIKIIDATEYTIEVTFPIENANVGGFNNTLHFRGFLSLDGQRALSPQEGTTVKINGVEASFTNDERGEWMAEVPLSIGEQTIILEVFTKGILQNNQEFALQNMPSAIPRTQAINGSNNLFSIGSNHKSIIIKNLNTGLENVIASIGDGIIPDHCEELERLTVSYGGDKVAFLCLDQSSGITLLTYELASSLIESNTFFRNFDNFSTFFWTSDDRLIVRAGASTFYSLPNTTETPIAFYIEGPSYIGRHYYADNNGFYLVDVDAPDLNLYYINLQDVPADSVNNNIAVNAQPMGAHIPDLMPFLIFSDVIITITDGSLTLAPISDPNLTTALVPADVSGEVSGILGLVDGDLIFSNYSEKVYRLNINSNDVEEIYVRKVNTYLGGNIFTNTDTSETVIFNHQNQLLTHFDLDTFKLISTTDLSKHKEFFNLSWSYSDYDWDTHTLFSATLDWGGTLASEQAQLFSINTKTNSLTPLLTGNDFQNYFNTPNETYTLGQVSYAKELNQLWFTIGAPYSNTDGFEGVYALDLASNSISDIYEYSLPEDSRPTSPYLSAFDSDTLSVALTKWDGGYLKIINADGEKTELIQESTPFITTTYSQIDSANDQVLTIGIPFNEETAYADLSKPSYITYDLNSHNFTEFASNTDTNKITLTPTLRFNYTPQNKLMYGVFSDQLIVLDTTSGDRVFKAIEQ